MTNINEMSSKEFDNFLSELEGVNSIYLMEMYNKIGEVMRR